MSHEEQRSFKKICQEENVIDKVFQKGTWPRQHPLMNNSCSWILLVFNDWHHKVKRSKDITRAERVAEISLVINVPTVAKISVLFNLWLPKSNLQWALWIQVFSFTEESVHNEDLVVFLSQGGLEQDNWLFQCPCVKWGMNVNLLVCCAHSHGLYENNS